MKDHSVKYPVLLEVIIKADTPSDAIALVEGLFAKSPLAPAMSVDFLALHCEVEFAAVIPNADDGSHDTVTTITSHPTDEPPERLPPCPACGVRDEIYSNGEGKVVCLICDTERTDIRFDSDFQTWCKR